GKTTSTSMVALILSQAGLSPSYIIGGFSPQLKRNAAAGQSDILILEADEYDRTFLSLSPEFSLITNVEWDHPDCYPTEADYQQVFVDFAKKTANPQQLIICGDNEGAWRLAQQFPKAHCYGLEDRNSWQATDVTLNSAGGYSFHIRHQGQVATPQPIQLSIPGKHNLLNALGAIITSHLVGIPFDKAGDILSTFHAPKRRFEMKGDVNGVTIIDDYAHHPSEIKACLAAAKDRFGSRPIWAVFQPHTFTRTRSLLSDFAQSFTDADHVILLDIFASAREQNDGTIGSADLLALMRHQDAQHRGSMINAINYLRAHLSSGDVVMTLGAGDGYKVGETLLAQGLLD
ncbi:MAG: cyanophycin synthetase, partial [Chloroflexota bacterium]